MNSQQAQVLLKGMADPTDLSEDKNYVFNELVENLEFIAKLPSTQLSEKDGLEDAYHLIQSEKSSCPTCEEKSSLLIHDGAIINPVFYICWKCRVVRQAGVGPVESGEE